MTVLFTNTQDVTDYVEVYVNDVEEAIASFCISHDIDDVEEIPNGTIFLLVGEAIVYTVHVN